MKSEGNIPTLTRRNIIKLLAPLPAWPVLGSLSGSSVDAKLAWRMGLVPTKAIEPEPHDDATAASPEELAALVQSYERAVWAAERDLRVAIRGIGLPRIAERFLLRIERQCIELLASMPADIRAENIVAFESKIDQFLKGMDVVTAFIEFYEAQGFPIVAAFNSVEVTLPPTAVRIKWALAKFIIALILALVDILWNLFHESPADPETVANNMLANLKKAVDNNRFDDDDLKTIGEQSAKGASAAFSNPNAGNVRDACNRLIAKLQVCENQETDEHRKRRFASLRAGVASGWNPG